MKIRKIEKTSFDRSTADYLSFPENYRHCWRRQAGLPLARIAKAVSRKASKTYGQVPPCGSLSIVRVRRIGMRP